MTDAELDALLALLAKATPGPWLAYLNGVFRHDHGYVCGRSLPAVDADAHLIAAARNALRPLVEEVRALRDREASIVGRLEASGYRGADAMAALDQAMRDLGQQAAHAREDNRTLDGALLAERAAHAATREALEKVRAAVIECAYCNGVGSLLCLPGDVIEPCPACGGLRAALAPAPQSDAVSSSTLTDSELAEVIAAGDAACKTGGHASDDEWRDARFVAEGGRSEIIENDWLAARVKAWREAGERIRARRLPAPQSDAPPVSEPGTGEHGTGEG